MREQHAVWGGLDNGAGLVLTHAPVAEIACALTPNRQCTCRL